MKSHIGYILFFIVLLAVSCRKNSSDDAGQDGFIACQVVAEQTKSTVSDDDYLQSTGFTMSAWLDDDYYRKGDEGSPSGHKGKYFGPSDVNCTGGKWSISGNPVWIVIDSTRFWCWAPKTLSHGTRVINPEEVDLTGKHNLDFTYTMPSGGAVSGTPAVACDAANQEDILFAYNCRWYEPYKTGSDSDEVNLRFYHPLSQVNFIVYPLDHGLQTSGDGSLRNDYAIIDIALQGILSSGRCTITGRPYYEMPAEKSGMMTFEWSGQSVSDDFTQYYGTSFSSASPSSVPSGWTYKDYGGKAHYSCDNSFFIVPQMIGNDAALAVTFRKDAKDVTKIVMLKGVSTSDGKVTVNEWQAGYRYTYRLAISGDITDPAALVVTLENWETVNDSMRF